MKSANVHQAKAHLSSLLREVESGETVVIMRGDKPVARLVPVEEVPRKKRVLGIYDGLGSIAEDFDAPLPDELLRLFQK